MRQSPLCEATAHIQGRSQQIKNEPMWTLGFKQKIIEIIIENGVLALVLLLLGLWINKKLEKFKSEQSLEGELNKLRVRKIGECFAVHSKYAKLLDGFIISLNEYRNSDLKNDEIVEKLTPRIEDLKKEKKEVDLITSSHKFWLGDEVHEKALKFNESFPNFCDVFHQGKFKRCVDLKMDMDQEMMDVDDIMWMLNKKIINSKKRKS